MCYKSRSSRSSPKGLTCVKDCAFGDVVVLANLKPELPYLVVPVFGGTGRVHNGLMLLPNFAATYTRACHVELGVHIVGRLKEKPPASGVLE